MVNTANKLWNLQSKYWQSHAHNPMGSPLAKKLLKKAELEIKNHPKIAKLFAEQKKFLKEIEDLKKQLSVERKIGRKAKQKVINKLAKKSLCYKIPSNLWHDINSWPTLTNKEKHIFIAKNGREIVPTYRNFVIDGDIKEKESFIIDRLILSDERYVLSAEDIFYMISNFKTLRVIINENAYWNYADSSVTYCGKEIYISKREY